MPQPISNQRENELNVHDKNLCTHALASQAGSLGDGSAYCSSTAGRQKVEMQEGPKGLITLITYNGECHDGLQRSATAHAWLAGRLSDVEIAEEHNARSQAPSSSEQRVCW